MVFIKRLYTKVYPTIKEDLIGTYYKCYWCNKKIKITKDGIEHYKNKHYINYTLEELFKQRLFDIEQNKRYFME